MDSGLLNSIFFLLLMHGNGTAFDLSGRDTEYHSASYSFEKLNAEYDGSISSAEYQTESSNPVLTERPETSDTEEHNTSMQKGKKRPKLSDLNEAVSTSSSECNSHVPKWNKYREKSIIKNGILKVPQISKSNHDEDILARFLSEIKAGDQAELFGSNPHYKQSSKYYDLSRRFVPQYPYSEKVVEDPLTPKLASPETVLAVAKGSALLEASKPANPTDELIHKDILRTGQYWDSVWRDDVDPTTLLRSKKKNNMPLVSTFRNYISLKGSMQAEIPPGSKLYDLVSTLKKISPRLLYVINIKDKKRDF